MTTPKPWSSCVLVHDGPVRLLTATKDLVISQASAPVDHLR